MASVVALSSPKCDSELLISNNENVDSRNNEQYVKSKDAVNKGIIQTGLSFKAKTCTPAVTSKNRRTHRKRRHSMNEDGTSGKRNKRANAVHQKKASAGDIILPTNFLLGGNISDPLNLNSLLDEDVSKALNAVTPSSSPLPPRSSTVNIVIPTDITDPLGLNTVAQCECGQGMAKESSHVNSTEKSISKESVKHNQKKKKKRRRSHNDKTVSANVVPKRDGLQSAIGDVPMSEVKSESTHFADPNELSKMQKKKKSKNLATNTLDDVDLNLHITVSEVISQEFCMFHVSICFLR